MIQKNIGGGVLRILGIDPGIATVGFGVIDAQRGAQRYVSCGVISTPAHTSLSSRLDQIYTDLEQLCDAFRCGNRVAQNKTGRCQ